MINERLENYVLQIIELFNKPIKEPIDEYSRNVRLCEIVQELAQRGPSLFGYHDVEEFYKEEPDIDLPGDAYP